LGQVLELRFAAWPETIGEMQIKPVAEHLTGFGFDIVFDHKLIPPTVGKR
jgi:hypothetical protein